MQDDAQACREMANECRLDANGATHSADRDGWTVEALQWEACADALAAAADALSSKLAWQIVRAGELRKAAEARAEADADYLDPDRLREDRDEDRLMDAEAARSGGNDE
tara:strand:+ start:1006 stop:1332 length:327 start_codon:yes stop_codon:yes gene_type:complete